MQEDLLGNQWRFRVSGPPSVACDKTGKTIYANLSAKRIARRFGTGSLNALLPANHEQLSITCLKTRSPTGGWSLINGHCLHWAYRRLPRREVVFAVGEQLSESVTESLRAGQIPKTVLAHLAFGIMVVDSGLNILYANPYAEATLESAWPGQIRQDRLFASIAPLRRELESFLKLGEGAMVLPRTGNKTPLEILVKTLPGLDECNMAPLAVVCIVDPDYTPSAFSARLQGLYQLTPAEARVAAVLRQGPRLEDAAALAGVSRNTIRTHVRRLCQKTGQSRLSELLWRLNACVAVALIDHGSLSTFIDLIR